MPSFYTENMYSGDKETLRSFVLRCAISSGAGLRASKGGDELLPIDVPPVVKCGDYHKNKLKEAQEWLDYYKKAKENRVNLFAVYEEFKKNTEEKNKEEMERIEAIKTRYLAMKEQVEKLDMSAEYHFLKEFMLKQLNEGIEYDCRYYETEILPIDEWIDKQIENYEWEVKYHTKELESEEKQVSDDIVFLDWLYGMLDKVDPYKDDKNTK